MKQISKQTTTTTYTHTKKKNYCEEKEWEKQSRRQQK